MHRSERHHRSAPAPGRPSEWLAVCSRCAASGGPRRDGAQSAHCPLPRLCGGNPGGGGNGRRNGSQPARAGQEGGERGGGKCEAVHRRRSFHCGYPRPTLGEAPASTASGPPLSAAARAWARHPRRVAVFDARGRGEVGTDGRRYARRTGDRPSRRTTAGRHPAAARWPPRWRRGGRPSAG